FRRLRTARARPPCDRSRTRSSGTRRCGYEAWCSPALALLCGARLLGGQDPYPPDLTGRLALDEHFEATRQRCRHDDPVVGVVDAGTSRKAHRLVVERGVGKYAQLEAAETRGRRKGANELRMGHAGSEDRGESCPGQGEQQLAPRRVTRETGLFGYAACSN